MLKILHFSPVRKPPQILQLHLQSLQKLENQQFQLTYSFFDDNINKQSSQILIDFVNSNTHSLIHDFDLTGIKNYNGSERWAPDLYNRITFIKNKAILYCLEEGYDYLFLSDSDLIIHPKTLINLVQQRKDFCSSIFWTHFILNPTYTPNAWYSKPQGFTVPDLLKLKEKGTFKVDFTGACSLLSREILFKGVSFEKIANLNYLGEDKHFCIRAAVLGFQPYVNTDFPSYHIYNEKDIQQGVIFLENKFDNSYLKEWLNEDWQNKIEKWLKPKKKSFLKKLFLRLAR